MSADTELQLYTYYRSSAAYRVRIALALKQLSYKQIPINLLKAEHKQKAYVEINRQGLVPALATSEGVVTQSLAIIEYLDEVYPHPPLLPKAAIDRAQVRAMAQQIAMEIHPLNNPKVTQFLTNNLGLSESDKLSLVSPLDCPGVYIFRTPLKRDRRNRPRSEVLLWSLSLSGGYLFDSSGL